jgi:membrane-bound lytic murein transglycosylase D
MKKLVLLFMLALSPIFWLRAQTDVNQPPSPSNEIYWQLDSLIPCHHFRPLAVAKYSRDSLNKYHFKIDSLPACSSDLVAQRLKEIGAQLPLAYNEDVQAFINLYTLQRREQVERMLGLAQVYFPIFDEVLDRQSMPMELRYLPIVESALNPHARSKVGATGLWQFMLSTGNMYGLNVTSYIDERRDPFKSTEAACRYLKTMYKTYGDWLLVVAAYNCGPGNVNKAIARSGGKRTFWEIQEFLPRETRSYVPALIAATYVFNYNVEHNLFPRMVDFTFAQDTVQISRQQISLKHFADVTDTDFWTLKDLNPELKQDVIPYSVTPYILRVPMKTGQLFATYRDSIMTLAATLKVDSARAVYTDARLSPLTNKPYVAEASESPTYATAAAAAGEGKSVVYHKVRRGEVVGTIASRYHVSPKDISKWNGLHNYGIKVGQSLKIYVKGGNTQSQPKITPIQEQPKAVVAEASKADAETKVEPAVVKSDASPVKTDANAPKTDPAIAKIEPKTVVTPPTKVDVPPAKVEPVVVKNDTQPKTVVPAPKTDVALVKPPVADKVVAKIEPKVEPKVVAKVEPKPDTKLSDLNARYHVVKQGDTLWQIANAYDGLTVEKIKSLNALPDNKLEVGQKLRVQ